MVLGRILNLDVKSLRKLLAGSLLVLMEPANHRGALLRVLLSAV